MILEFIIFLVGFLLGSIIIWFVRQKEFDSLKQNQEELKKNFQKLTKRESIKILFKKLFFIFFLLNAINTGCSK